MVKRVIKGWDCERARLEFEEEGEDEWLLLNVRCASANLKPGVSVRGGGDKILAGNAHHINDYAEASIIVGYGWIVAYTFEYGLDLLFNCNNMYEKRTACSQADV